MPSHSAAPSGPLIFQWVWCSAASIFGNRKNKLAFWASRKVPKKPRGVNRANQQSQNERVSACEKGLTGPCAKDVAKDLDPWWRLGLGKAKEDWRLRE